MYYMYIHDSSSEVDGDMHSNHFQQFIYGFNTERAI